jgi:hypothetical protein
VGNHVPVFSASYNAARGAFLAATKAQGGHLESYRHPKEGPSGEPLFTDVARFGPEDASRVLFVSSGTHGVEGRCGSGIQRALLETGACAWLPRHLAVVLVHAVNPFGFAHDRRFDHENVDVNRNFTDHRAPHPPNPCYATREGILTPKGSDSGPACNPGDAMATLLVYGLINGVRPMLKGAMGAQYRHPQGIQYGGLDPSWSNETMHTIWARHVRDAELAVHIDVHTGLGPGGVGTLLQGADPDEPRAATAREWWGTVHRTPRPSPERTITFGELATGFEYAVSAPRSLGVMLELGT